MLLPQSSGRTSPQCRNRSSLALQLLKKKGETYLMPLSIYDSRKNGKGEWDFGILILNCRPPLWYSGQSSWLQIQSSGIDSRCYQIFWEVVGLERGPLRFVNTTEELFGRKSSGSGLEIREYGRRDPSLCPCGTIYPQKLAPNSQTSGGRSVGIVSCRTQVTEFSLVTVRFWTVLLEPKKKSDSLSDVKMTASFFHKRWTLLILTVACSNVAGSSTTQRVRFPLISVVFFNLPNPSRLTTSLGFTQLLTEIEPATFLLVA
jgi:hypothetical protein